MYRCIYIFIYKYIYLYIYIYIYTSSVSGLFIHERLTFLRLELFNTNFLPQMIEDVMSVNI